MTERNGITLARINEVTEYIGDDMHKLPAYLHENNACVVATPKLDIDEIVCQTKAKGKSMAVIV